MGSRVRDRRADERRRASACGRRQLGAGRAGRRERPGGRSASGRRGRSRTSIATSPRRTSPASAAAPVPLGEVRRRRQAVGVRGRAQVVRARPTWRGPSGRPAGARPRPAPAPAARPVVGAAGQPAARSAARRRRRRASSRASRGRAASSARRRRTEAGRGPRARRGRGPAAGPPASWSSRSRIGRRRACRGRPRSRAGGALGDQLEPLEQPRRQHRPQDERRRREVVRRDPAGERQRRAAGAAARRPGRARRSASCATPGRRARPSPSTIAERLPAARTRRGPLRRARGRRARAGTWYV